MTGNIVAVSRLRAALDYNPDTGAFHRVSNGGNIAAGYINDRSERGGYICLELDGVKMFAHRAAWAYFHGKWPDGVIDHINRVKSDNRIANLRDVSLFQNQQNRGKNKNNSSGFKGVSWNGGRGKWHAQIMHQRKRIHIGLFVSPIEAYDAYVQMAKKLHSCRPENQ